MTKQDNKMNKTKSWCPLLPPPQARIRIKVAKKDFNPTDDGHSKLTAIKSVAHCIMNF